jgi:hypothetical protein
MGDAKIDYKAARAGLADAIKDFSAPFADASDTPEQPILNLIAYFGLLWANKEQVYPANINGRQLLQHLVLRATTKRIAIAPNWHEEVSNTFPPTAITTDAHLLAFFEKLGAGGQTDSKLAQGLADARQAAFLFPTAYRAITLTRILLAAPNVRQLFAHIPQVLAALWSVEKPAVEDELLAIMLAPDSLYVDSLMQAYSLDRFAAQSLLNPLRVASQSNVFADPVQRPAAFSTAINLFQTELTRNKPATVSTTLALGAIASAARAPPPVAAPAADPLAVILGKLGVIDERLGAMEKRSTAKPSEVCSYCHKIGHTKTVCFKLKRDQSKKYTAPTSTAVGSVAAAQPAANDEKNDEPWPEAQTLRASVAVSARQSSEPRDEVATFDTGAPFSALSPATASRHGCVVRPYRGPRLHGPDGAPLHVVGQTTLASVRIGAWSGPVGPLAIVDGLEWAFLFGLADMARCASMHIDFTMRPPSVTFGAAPAPSIAVAAVRAQPDAVPDTLAAVSAVAAAADAALQREDARNAASATAVPPSMGAAASRNAKPMIDARSPDEIAFKQAFQYRNRDAYKLAEVEGPAWFQAAARTLLKKHRGVFAVKDVLRKPPVIDVSKPGAYPLELHLKAGFQVRTQEQPVFESTRDAHILARERDTLISERRAAPAVRAPAIASSFVVDGVRVVYAAAGANDICYSSAYTLPPTDSHVQAFADFDGRAYLQADFLEGFSNWVYAEGSGAIACIHVGGQVLEPKVPSMGIHCVPGEFHKLVSSLFAIDASDVERDPKLRDTLLKTFVDDAGGAAKNHGALLSLLAYFLETCEYYGFTINVAKFRVGGSSLIHTGSLIEGNKIKPLEDYSAAILSQGRPETRAQLVRFIGKTGWVLPHLHDVFEELAIVRGVLRRAGSLKHAALHWSDEAAAAFEAVRAALADPRVLYGFDASKTVFALTDAADLTGASLIMQLHTGADGKPVLRLVMALCINFTGAEKNYTTPEKELAAFRHGCTRLPHLTLGRTVIWLTDNLAMARLLQSARVSKKRRLRTTWLDLQGVRVRAVHIAGNLNTLADALSRNPTFENTPPIDESAEVQVSLEQLDLGGLPRKKRKHVAIGAFRPAALGKPVVARPAALATAAAQRTPTESVAQLLAQAAARVSPALAAQAAELQDVDESLAFAHSAAADGSKWLDCAFAYGSVGELRLLFAQLPASETNRAADSQRRWVLVVPRGMRQPLLETIHAATAHGAIARFLRTLLRSFWWPTLRQDARVLIGACDSCARARRVVEAGNVGNIEREALMQPTRPGEIYEIDSWTWPMPNGTSMNVMSAIDAFDGFVMLELVDRLNAATAARLARRLHDNNGAFRVARTDGGPEYKGEFAALLARMGAAHRRGTAYNSNAQARIERSFRNLNDLIVTLFTHNAAAALLPLDIVSAASVALNTTASPPTPGAPASTAFERHYGRPAPLSMLLACTAVPDAGSLLPIDPAFAHFVLAMANESRLPEGGPKPLQLEERTVLRRAQEARTQQSTAAAPLKVAPGDLVFVVNDKVPMGKIVKRVRARLGPFIVVSVSDGAADAPLRARVGVLGGDASLQADVFVRHLTPCGPKLHIDDPMLRLLPSSGYFAAELVDDDSEMAMQRLQALTEQALEPHLRTRVAAAARARSAANVAEEEWDLVSVASADEGEERPVLFDDDSDDESPDSADNSDDDSDEDNVSVRSAASASSEVDSDDDEELAARPQRDRQRPIRYRS